jgi:hypothetical protein
MAALSTAGYRADQMDTSSTNLAANVRRLREGAASQQQIAKLAGCRDDLGQPESGAANPTGCSAARPRHGSRSRG